MNNQKNNEEFNREDLKFHEGNHTFSDEKSFDYNQVSDEIFLGTNMCCQIGYSQELLDKDVVGDISLEKDRIDNPFGVDYFLWLPVEDHHPPTQKQINLGVQAINFFVENNIKLYVHCENGHGRAPTLVMAYFIFKGMDAEGAIDFVKSKRPSVHLWDDQRDALNEYKKSL